MHAVSHLSRVQLCVTPWTVAIQAPLSTGFSRQEHWSVFPCPPPGDLHDPAIKPASLTSPALAGGFFTTESSRKPSDSISALTSFESPKLFLVALGTAKAMHHNYWTRALEPANSTTKEPVCSATAACESAAHGPREEPLQWKLSHLNQRKLRSNEDLAEPATHK